MSYKTIVVHVAGDHRVDTRIEVAAQLALKFGAHLVGVHAMPLPQHRHAVRAELMVDLLAHERELRHKAAAVLAEKFEAITAAAGVQSREWRATDIDPVEALSLSSRYADLLVLSQSDPNEQPQLDSVSVPDMIAEQAGRPTLIIPFAGRFPTVGSRVLVAWNASREAARAVADARPFLKSASAVTLMCVNVQAHNAPWITAAGTHGALPGTDCALYLARHGVKVDVSNDTGVEIDTGNYILSRATDLASDLIVMGAYGHSRMRELILGGVTQTILEHMTVPVLLSR